MEIYPPLLRVCGTTLSMYIFHLLDRVATGLHLQKPYYAIHVLHNLCIMGLTAGDIIATLTQFHEIPYLPFNWPAVCLVYGLHLYHCTAYWRSFQYDDWLHHGLMIGVALPLGSTVAAGPLMGFSLFFTTGLPGAISYAALFAEKNRWLSRATSKRLNAATNVWIRSPGCAAQAALTLTALLSTHTTTAWELGVGLCTAGLNYWNGQYFMQQVVQSASRLEGERVDVNNRGPSHVVEQ